MTLLQAKFSSSSSQTTFFIEKKILPYNSRSLPDINEAKPRYRKNNRSLADHKPSGSLEEPFRSKGSISTRNISNFFSKDLFLQDLLKSNNEGKLTERKISSIGNEFNYINIARKSPKLKKIKLIKPKNKTKKIFRDISLKSVEYKEKSEDSLSINHRKEHIQFMNPIINRLINRKKKVIWNDLSESRGERLIFDSDRYLSSSRGRVGNQIKLSIKELSFKPKKFSVYFSKNQEVRKKERSVINM